VDIPVLGLVENMAAHVCSQCGHTEHIFGSGGGQWMSDTYGVPVLGSLPLEISIRAQGDAGQPIVIAEPDSPAAQAYQDTARALLARLAQRPKVRTGIMASLMGS
jgi:ATP-binding protein involved in chromosome partitioning